MANLISRSFAIGIGFLCFLGTVMGDDQPSGHDIVSPGDTIVALKETTKGRPNILAESGDYGGVSGNEELVSQAIDDNIRTKYFNKAADDAGSPGVGTGFVVKPHLGATLITGIQFCTANDAPERDPLSITIEGSNTDGADKAKAKDFTLIYKGQAGLTKDPDRGFWGQAITFTNTESYKYYRVLVTQVRGGDSADAVQFAEVRLVGAASN